VNGANLRLPPANASVGGVNDEDGMSTSGAPAAKRSVAERSLRGSADRHTAMAAPWAIVSTATYEHDVHG
jgi:hypothetical protein